MRYDWLFFSAIAPQNLTKISFQGNVRSNVNFFQFNSNWCQVLCISVHFRNMFVHFAYWFGHSNVHLCGLRSLCCGIMLKRCLQGFHVRFINTSTVVSEGVAAILGPTLGVAASRHGVAPAIVCSKESDSSASNCSGAGACSELPMANPSSCGAASSTAAS